MTSDPWPDDRDLGIPVADIPREPPIPITSTDDVDALLSSGRISEAAAADLRAALTPTARMWDAHVRRWGVP